MVTWYGTRLLKMPVSLNASRCRPREPRITDVTEGFTTIRGSRAAPHRQPQQVGDDAADHAGRGRDHRRSAAAADRRGPRRLPPGGRRTPTATAAEAGARCRPSHARAIVEHLLEEARLRRARLRPRPPQADRRRAARYHRTRPPAHQPQFAGVRATAARTNSAVSRCRAGLPLTTRSAQMPRAAVCAGRRRLSSAELGQLAGAPRVGAERGLTVPHEEQEAHRAARSAISISAAQAEHVGVRGRSATRPGMTSDSSPGIQRSSRSVLGPSTQPSATEILFPRYRRPGL